MGDIVDDADATFGLVESGARFKTRTASAINGPKQCRCGRPPAFVTVAGGRKTNEVLTCKACSRSTSPQPSRQLLVKEWNGMF